MTGFSYDCQNRIADAYRWAGGAVAVRINRNGSRRVSIDGGRETDVRTAMRRLEQWLTTPAGRIAERGVRAAADRA